MLNNYMGIIYISTSSENIRSLTKVRPLASVPVGGSYRVIDFSLSNLVNAGIRNVGIFAGNEDLNSLTDHLGKGAEWDLNRKKDGIFIFERMLDTSYANNAKRIKKNMEYFIRSKQKYVVVMSAHMIANVDIADVIKKHEESGKEVTIVYKKVNNANEKYDNCDCVKIDKNGEIESIGQNLFFRKNENISLEIFIMSKELLVKMICDGIQDGGYYSARDLIAKNIGKISINGYEFKGYMSCMNTTKEYFDFNMDLLNKKVRDDLFTKPGRNIYTKVKDTPPTMYEEGADVRNTLISNGCIIGGTVRNSILSRGTVIEKGAFVEDCIILQSCVIRSGAVLKNIIIDKNNIIKSNERLSASRNYPLVIEKTIKWDKNYLHDFLEKFEE